MIGDRLKELRDEAEMSQQAFGEIAQTGKQYVGRLEKGINKDPNPKMIEAWAKHFGVRMEWITSGRLPKKVGDAPDQSHPVELNMVILRSSIVSVKEATKKLHLQFDAYDTAPILAFAYRERSKLPLDLDRAQLKEFDKAVLMELKGEIGDEKERPASARGKGVSKEAAPGIKKARAG